MFVPKMKLVSGKTQRAVRTLERNEVSGLVSAPDTVQTQNLLSSIRGNGEQVECQCSRIYHTCQRKKLFLRSNPGQDIKCPFPCALGEGHIHASAADVTEDNQSARKRSEFHLGLLLNENRISATAVAKSEDEAPPDSSGVKKPKYPGMFQTLHYILECQRYTGWYPSTNDQSTFGWKRFWEDIQKWVSRYCLALGYPTKIADITWSPHESYKGGLVDLNTRLRTKWTIHHKKPEGWAFGILDSFPDPNEIGLHKLAPRQRALLAEQNKPVFPPLTFAVGKHQIAAIGQTAPFLMLAVCSANYEKGQYIKPTFRRVVLQSIVSADWPVPVESSYEREIALMLRRFKLPFKKPTFANDQNLRPDFVLPHHHIILEVQGMNSDEYREHKKIIHRRMLDHPDYRGYRLVRYDPNDGEQLKDFEKKFLKALHAPAHTIQGTTYA